MTSGVIAPVARSLYLAYHTLGDPGGKSDVMGLFNAITPANG